jgi:hypothetical protein
MDYFTNYLTPQNGFVLKRLTFNQFFKKFHIKEVKSITVFPKPAARLSFELVQCHTGLVVLTAVVMKYSVVSE